MIDILKQQFSDDMPDNEKINRLREFLQVLCLKIISDKGAFRNLAFTGGTALRIIFGLRRFSEDLDFSLIDKNDYDFSALNAGLIRGFELNGLKVASTPKKDKTVHNAMLKFTSILKELGLSPLEGQKLSIKLEIDTNPPQGGNVLSTLVNKVYVVNITHFDLPSLFATKLHACFYRRYTKGRDLYDLIWYLGKRVKPNYLLLNNAVIQTQGEDPGVNENNFKDYMLKNIGRFDFAKANIDVERFLEDKSELRLFNLRVLEETIRLAY